MMYNLESKFDIEQHKKYFKHYFEAILFPDGHVEYAVPSHQEKLIGICQEKLYKTRQEIADMCPEEYYGDFIVWLCNISGCVSLWDNFMMKSDCEPLTNAQYNTLVELKNAEIFFGDF